MRPSNTVIDAMFILTLSTTSVVRGAEVTPPNPVPRASLIKVAHDGHAWVMAIEDGKIVAVESHTCEGHLIFAARYDSYMVFGIDANEKQFQHIVEVADDEDDPGPDPDPNPDPDPGPVPDEVERLLGIGPTAYRLAVRHGTASEIDRLSKAYLQAATYLHEMRLTPEEVQRQLRDVRGKLSAGWSKWEAGVEPLVFLALSEHGTGQREWRDVCREIGQALRIAAANKGGRKTSRASPYRAPSPPLAPTYVAPTRRETVFYVPRPVGYTVPYRTITHSPTMTRYT